MNCTATDPSPTPDATRFTEPCRTSPTAKSPGIFVSSRKGSRSRVQPLGCCPSRMRSGPVRIKPRSSRSMRSASQSVRGSAPIKMNIAAGRYALDLPCIRTQNRNFFQMSLAVGFDHAGMRPDLNIGCLLDLVNQILRHGAGERIRREPESRRAPRTWQNSWRPVRPNSRLRPRKPFLRRGESLRGSASVINSGPLQTVDSRSV